MDTETEGKNRALKSTIEQKYAALAKQEDQESCGCGSSCCAPNDESVTTFSQDYSQEEGYTADADLQLGCGIPTRHAGLSAGQTVLDLGSGAGLDAFVARRTVGENGRVIGVDMTLEMIEKARRNAVKLGYDNVEFRLGEIEQVPVSPDSVDVILSNCVLNLVPEKAEAFIEMYRVLKPGAHFCVSDIVTRGELPDEIRETASLYAGCVAGALPVEHYLELLREAGFRKVEVVEERELELPEHLFGEDLNPEQVEAFQKSGTGLFSVTVKGFKPAEQDTA